MNDNRDMANAGEQWRYLPSAMAVQQRPASPLGRVLLWLLLTLLLIAVGWACIGEVDVVVSASGRVVPSGRVKLVQPAAAGTVTGIHVADGQWVERGQRLVSLDQTASDAAVRKLSRALRENALHSSWRRAFDGWLEAAERLTGKLQEPAPDEPALAGRAEALLVQHRAEVVATLSELDQRLAASRAQQDSLHSEQQRVRATLEIHKQRTALYQTLLDRQYGAKLHHLQLLQEQTELQQSLPVLAARERQVKQDAAALLFSRVATRVQYRRQNLLELNRLRGEQDRLTQDLRAATLERQQHVISAPASGRVHELAVHTLGAVVSPGQVIARVVPQDRPLEVEVLLRNQDIGRLFQGQRAQLKIEAFNFTKYGLIEAKVMSIGDDAVQDESLGWVFRARLRPEQEYLQVADRRLPLTPGMVVTAEIISGKRRLIEYFLSPLLRQVKESVREP